MPIPVTAQPFWYGPERTGCPLLNHLGAHRVVRANRIPEHALPVAEAALVVSGSLALVVGGTRIDLRGGTFAVIPARTPFASAPGPNRCAVYWVGIGSVGRRTEQADALFGADRRRELEELVARAALTVHPLPDVAAAAAEACFESIRAEADAIERCGRGLVLVAALRQALVSAHGPVAVPAVDAALALIEHRLDRPPRLAELAAACGLGRTVFCTAFRARTGFTPADYLLQRRLERAAALLVEPGATVAGVARRLGFSSSRYFATAFRRVSGRRPSSLLPGG